MVVKRGGAREGAGRKPVKIKKKAVSVALTPEALRVLKKLQDKIGAKNPSQTVDALLIQTGQNLEKDVYQKFWDMLDQCPRLSGLWDRERQDLDIERLDQEIRLMSSGEVHLAKFLAGVWLGQNQYGFDAIEAMHTLSPDTRKVVADWMADPFFP